MECIQAVQDRRKVHGNRELRHALQLLADRIDDPARIFHRFDQHQVAEIPGQLLAEPPHILRALVEHVDLLERAGTVVLVDALCERLQMPAAGEPRRLRHERITDRARTAADALVEDRKRIAHAAVRRDRNQHCSVAVDLHVLLFADEFEPLGNVLRGDAPEVKPLAAGEDRRQQLVHLGCREDKNHVCGRLLQRL